jgi:uncharacterized protein with PIN domain
MISDGWYCCPYCNKKLFPVKDDTVVENLPFKCKACKHEIIVSIDEKQVTEKV